MKSVFHIAWYTIRDITRNRWGFMYTLFFAVATVGLFLLQSHSAKVAVSLMSICLFLIPLVSSLFGTIYFYNSREFIELVLTQPISRKTVFLGMFAGLSCALIAGFSVGIGVPFIFWSAQISGQVLSLALLLSVGSFLTVIFLALSFLSAISFDDRGKGIAVTLGVWLFTALVYDGLILLAAMSFSDYPLEVPLLAASMANPIDLARVTLLVQTDWAALMGYTGAVFSSFFGTNVGISIAALSLLAWSIGPLMIGIRKFRFKDL